MSKKTYTWIFIVVAIAIVALMVYLFWNKLFPAKDEQIEKQEAEQELKDIQTGNMPVTTLMPEGSLPLIVKDKNKKVKLMQEALIKLGCSISAGATGYFGSQTQAALTCAGYNDSKIEKVDYDNILAGKKKVIAVKPGSSLEANKDGVQLYDEGLAKTITKNNSQFIGTAISVNTSTNLVKFKSGSKYGYVYLIDVKLA